MTSFCIDKLYITQSEWTNWFGGARTKKEEITYKKLPFNHCALSLKPYNDPVCTPDGTIFDLISIVPYIRKHGTNPVTGNSLDVKDLIKLNIAKNPDGEYYCPITLKNFHDNLHIVANRKTGNVYAKEAIDKLNEWNDFITGEPFIKTDLIVLQNPDDLERNNMVRFHHLKAGFEKDENDEKEDRKKAEQKNVSSTSRSKGKVAASLTSTFVTPATTDEYSTIDEEQKMFKAIRSLGRAIMRTNFGDMIFELECQKVPKTCYNFIELSKKGYYQNVRFHRLIPGFMVQGGDPTGEGSGGQSIWGNPFENEFHQSLSHSKRGILSMANTGKPRSNTSQFFITFAGKKHLDRLHPVFGHLISGDDILDKMEAVPQIDSVPQSDIIIEDIVIMVDPFEEYRKEQKALKGDPEKKRLAVATDPTLALKRAKSSANTPLTIGKYMKK